MIDVRRHAIGAALPDRPVRDGSHDVRERNAGPSCDSSA
jgi:hypothetical protein